MRANVVFLLILAAGCGGEGLLPADFAACPVPEAVTPAEGLTYYRDVKPILDGRCVGCHVEDGIAPFSLEVYADAAHWSDLLAIEVEARRMPPWQPADCCQPYRWDRTLTEEQIATITGWVAQGAPAGDAEDEGPALDVDDSALARVDATVTMPEAYTPIPQVGFSDVRCFVLDFPIADAGFVTGFAVRPSNRGLVHHVIAFLADEGDVPGLEAKDAETDAPGWPCGGFGLELQPTGYIGGWTPGVTAVTFPEGLGREVPARSAVVLQIHYSTAHGSGSDQTSLDVMFEASVDQVARQMGVGNPLWLVSGGLAIDAGDPDATFWFAFDPTTVAEPEGFRIWSVNLHMHERGSSASLAILRRDGTTDCLLHIPAWDFAWLGDYWLEEDVSLYPGDQLYVECHFDNSEANQPFENGAPGEPRDLDWGTDEEMCGGVLTIGDRS